MDTNVCPHRVRIKWWSYFLVGNVGTTLSRLWEEHVGRAASTGRQMMEETVQSDGVLYPLGDAGPSVPSTALMFKLLYEHSNRRTDGRRLSWKYYIMLLSVTENTDFNK